VFSDGGEQTTTYDIAVGIYKAVNGGAMIVNLSLGGDGDSSFLKTRSSARTIRAWCFLAAAGNTPTTAPTYPAAYSQVIAITASDRSGNLASYANRGDFVDGIAPGGASLLSKASNTTSWEHRPRRPSPAGSRGNCGKYEANGRQR